MHHIMPTVGTRIWQVLARLMEYERALYRVYERTLDTLRFDAPCIGDMRFTKPTAICHFLLHMTWATALLILAATTCLHINFVGHAGCLGDALEATRPYINGTVGPLVGKDEVLSVHILPGGDLLPGYHPYPTFNDSELPPSLVDYYFTRNTPLLYLSPQFWSRHNVSVRNVTVAEYCVAGTPLLAWVINLVSSYDTVVINNLMYTLHTDGTLVNRATNESWGWESSQLPPVKGYRPEVSVLLKFLVLIKSLVAFILTFSITALIVRVLMSSGVVLMFPLFYCLRGLGWGDLDLHLLTLSYPWLGVPIEQLTARNKPVAPFIVAHITKVVVYYTMYEACQLLWAETLYNKSVPGGLQFYIYGVVMLCEYYAMIYCRSLNGIRYFPRVVLLYFLLYHFYFYSFPYGFFDEMLLACFLLILHAMIYVIIFLELPACRRGDVSYEQPRALYTDVGIPAWPAALPPSWSLFLAVNAQSRPSGDIYRESVPQRPANGGPGNGTGERIAIEMDGQELVRTETGSGSIDPALRPPRRSPSSESTEDDEIEGSNGSGDDRQPMLRRFRRSSGGGSGGTRSNFV